MMIFFKDLLQNFSKFFREGKVSKASMKLKLGSNPKIDLFWKLNYWRVMEV